MFFGGKDKTAGDGQGLQIPFGGYRSMEDCRALQSPSWTVVFPKGRTPLALQLETDARDARNWSPAGAYRADGMLRDTEY